MTSRPPSEDARQVVGCLLAAAHCHPGVQPTRRCLAFRTAEGVLLQSRQLRPLTRYFPEIATALADQLAPGTVLDGELVIYQEGRLDVTALQRRIHPSAMHAARRATFTPACAAWSQVRRCLRVDLRPTCRGSRLARDRSRGCSASSSCTDRHTDSRLAWPDYEQNISPARVMWPPRGSNPEPAD
jgi:hypothetical protein